METVGTWQRIYLGKRIGKRRDWLFEQVKITLWAAFRSGCGSASISSQVVSGSEGPGACECLTPPPVLASKTFGPNGPGARPGLPHASAPIRGTQRRHDRIADQR